MIQQTNFTYKYLNIQFPLYQERNIQSQENQVKMHKKPATTTKLKLNTLPNEPVHQRQGQNFQFKSISQDPDFIEQENMAKNLKNNLISPTFANSDTISLTSMSTVRNGKQNLNLNNAKQIIKKDKDTSKGHHNPRISQLSEISNQSSIPETSKVKKQKKRPNTSIQKHPNPIANQFDQGKYQIQVGQNHRLVQTIEVLTLKNEKLSQLYKACKKQLQKKLPQVFLKLKNSSPDDEDNIDLYLEMMAAVGKSKNLRKQKDELQTKKNEIIRKLEQFDTINHHLMRQVENKNKQLIRFAKLEQQKIRLNQIEKRIEVDNREIQQLKEANNKQAKRISQLQQQLAKGIKIIKDRQAELTDIRKKQFLSEQIEKSRNALAKNKKQLEDKLKKTSDKLEQTKGQLQSSLEKIKSLQKANLKLKGQVDKNITECAIQSQFEQNKNLQIQQLKQQIKELQQKSFTDQMANNDLRKQNTQLIKKVEKFQQQLENRNKEISQLKTANKSLQENQCMIGMIKQEVGKIRQNQNLLIQQNALLRKQRDEFNQKIEGISKQNTELIISIEDFKQTVVNQQKQLEQLKKKILSKEEELKNHYQNFSQEELCQDTSEFRIRRAIKYDDYSKKKKPTKSSQKHQKAHIQNKKIMSQNYEQFAKKQRLAANLYKIKSILNQTISRNAQYNSLPQNTDRSSIFSRTKTESVNRLISKAKIQNSEQAFEIQTEQILNMARMITNQFFALKQELVKLHERSNLYSKECSEDECGEEQQEQQESEQQEQQVHQILETKQRVIDNLIFEINLKQKIISKLTSFIPENLKQIFVDYIFAIQKLVQSKKQLQEAMQENINYQMNNSSQFARSSNFYQANSIMMNFEKNFNELGGKFDKEIQIWKLNKEIKQQKMENQLRELRKMIAYNHSQSVSGNYISTPHQKKNEFYSKKSTQYRIRQEQQELAKNHRVKTQHQNYLSFGGNSSLQENSCQLKNEQIKGVPLKPKKKNAKGSDRRDPLKKPQELSKNQIRDKYYLR